MSAPAPASPVRQAIRDSIVAQAHGIVFQAMLLQGGVAALLLLSLGGSEFEVGLIFMLHNAAFMARLLAAPKLDVGRLKWIVYRWQVISCAAAAAVLAVYPFAMRFDPAVGRWLIVVALGGYFVARQMGQAAWPPLMSQIIPPRLRGRFFGRMRTMLRLGAFAGILFAGLILGQDPAPWQFIPVLAVGVIAYAVRLYFLAKLPDPEAPRDGAPESLWRVLRRPMTDTPFRRFVSIAFCVRLLPMLTLPFVVPFLVRELGVPSSYAVYASGFAMIGGMLTLGMWGRMADRWGSRSTYTCGLVALACSAVLYAGAPSYDLAPAATLALAALGFALHGAGVAAAGIAETVRMMRQAPGEFRGSYMTLVATAHGLAGAASSLLGGWLLTRMPAEIVLLDQAIYAKRVYFLGASMLVLSTIATLAWLTPVGEPRPRHRLEPLVELASLSSVPPLGYLRALLRRRRGAEMDEP